VKLEEKEERNEIEFRLSPVQKAIYPPAIQKLKKANFFKPKKSLDDAIRKFESMGVPTREKRTAIRSALINDARKKNSTLNAAKEDNVWFFWQDG
jgi:hypothetical protein